MHVWFKITYDITKHYLLLTLKTENEKKNIHFSTENREIYRNNFVLKKEWKMHISFSQNIMNSTGQ